MALVLAVPSLKKFSDDDMSASFWNEVVGKQMGFQAEATRIHESLASEFGLITVGCLKQPWVTLTMIETAVVKATQSETHPEGRRGWMRSIQHLLQHQFSTMAPGAPVSAALALSGSLTCGPRLPLYAPKDGLKLGEKLKLEGTLDEIRLPGVLDTMEYETENPFVADLSANDTKEISKHVFLQRALADNYVSGDKEVEKKYAKLLKAKYLGKPAFSGDWKKILKGRAAMGRRTSASVRHPAPLCLYSCTAPPCCTTLTVFCSSQTIYSKSLKDMVDQADIDAKIRDGSLESLYLGSITVGSQEPKYYSHHKENVSPGSALATAIVQTAPTNVVLPPTWSDALKKPAAAPLIAPSIAARKLSPHTKSANLSQLREEATAASNIPRPPCYGEEPMPDCVPPAGKQREKKGRGASKAPKAVTAKKAAAKRPLELAKSFCVINSPFQTVGLRSAPEPAGKEANIIYIDVEKDLALCVDKGDRVEIVEEKTLYRADDVTLVDEHWVKISVDEKSGWLKAKYTTKEPPAKKLAAAKRPAAAKKLAVAKKKPDEADGSEDGSDDEIDISSDEESSDDEDAYDVECIVDERRKGKTTEFRVKWEGWSADDNTWEPLEHVQHTDAYATWRARAA